MVTAPSSSWCTAWASPASRSTRGRSVAAEPSASGRSPRTQMRLPEDIFAGFPSVAAWSSRMDPCATRRSVSPSTRCSCRPLSSLSAGGSSRATPTSSTPGSATGGPRCRTRPSPPPGRTRRAFGGSAGRSSSSARRARSACRRLAMAGWPWSRTASTSARPRYGRRSAAPPASLSGAMRRARWTRCSSTPAIARRRACPSSSSMRRAPRRSWSAAFCYRDARSEGSRSRR
mmetsp:Transcript_64270/g.184713  ORF Transcript_64270/g.184713 Transcript_64270/m.184713 type:complete len:231 (+) Transcript_64270:1834-2526(+)